MPTDTIGAQVQSNTIPPVGSILAWAKTLTGVPSLPSGWVECNGQVLTDSDSLLNGDTIPNLNASGGGTQRFLRGNTTSGTTGGSGTVTLTTNEMPAHSHTYSKSDTGSGSYGGFPNSGLTTTATSSAGSGAAFSILNPYYEVVWIMRVK